MSTHVTILDPDNPSGSPAYDGPADQAHRYIEPGSYRGYDSRDRTVTLVVTDTESHLR